MSYGTPPPPSPYGQSPLGGGPYQPGNAGDALREATIQQAAQRFFQKYANFNGRASRSEFWFWFLISFIVSAVFGFLIEVSGLFRILEGLWWLATIVPTFALGARRLHDTGRSGWWQLIWLTCVGYIVLIVWWATAPKPAGDQYNNA